MVLWDDMAGTPSGCIHTCGSQWIITAWRLSKMDRDEMRCMTYLIPLFVEVDRLAELRIKQDLQILHLSLTLLYYPAQF